MLTQALLDTSVFIVFESGRSSGMVIMPDGMFVCTIMVGHAGVNDLWIASVALSRSLPVATLERDYAALTGLGETWPAQRHQALVRFIPIAVRLPWS